MNTLSQFKKHVADFTGSAATTPKGILLAWRKHRATNPQVNRFADWRARRQTHLIIPWKQQEKDRTADPELKRATKDKVFRKNLVTRFRQPVNAARCGASASR